MRLTLHFVSTLYYLKMNIKHFKHWVWKPKITLSNSSIHLSWNTMITNFETIFSAAREICSLLNLYCPWPVQTNLSYLWQYKSNWTPRVKTCTHAHTDKFEAITWLLVQMCQTRTRTSAKSQCFWKKHTPGPLDFGLLPSCTSHFQKSGSDINHLL